MQNFLTLPPPPPCGTPPDGLGQLQADAVGGPACRRQARIWPFLELFGTFFWKFLDSCKLLGPSGTPGTPLGPSWDALEPSWDPPQTFLSLFETPLTAAPWAGPAAEAARASVYNYLRIWGSSFRLPQAPRNLARKLLPDSAASPACNCLKTV